MADVSVTGEQLHIGLSTWEKIGALTGNVSVPTDSIRRVERLDNARTAIQGIRAPGTGLPGVIALGRWRRKGAVDFVAVYRNDPGYVVELVEQSFDRLIFSTDPIDGLDALV